MNNKIVLLVVSVLIVMLVLGLGWYFVSQRGDFSLSAPLSSGSPSNSSSDVLQLPTVEMPKTNPFEGVKFNPFE